MPRVVVVGAGPSGLAAADRLLGRGGIDVTVLEASSRPGGLVRTTRRDGFLFERGPDSIFTEKPAGLALLQRIGLENEIVRPPSSPSGAYVVHAGGLVRIPEGFTVVAPSRLDTLAASRVLSWRGLIRAGLEPLVPSRPASSQSLAAFVKRRFGPEILERLAQPLAGGIYGTDPELLDLGATLPRFLALEAEHGSVLRGLAKTQARKPDRETAGVRYGLFVSLRDGMERFVQVLAARLGRSLVLDAPVTRIERERLGYRVEVEGRAPISADAVVVAVPAPAAARILEPLDADVAAGLRAIRFGSMSAVTLAYERARIPHPLDAFGLVVPAVEGRPVAAMTFASVKWPGRAPAGFELLRVFVGGVARPDAPREPDDALVAAARRELQRLLGIEAAPLFVEIDRYLDAMPRYEVGHAERVIAIEAALARHDRLAIAGNSLYGVGIPDAIAAGERAADRVAPR